MFLPNGINLSSGTRSGLRNTQDDVQSGGFGACRASHKEMDAHKQNRVLECVLGRCLLYPRHISEPK